MNEYHNHYVKWKKLDTEYMVFQCIESSEKYKLIYNGRKMTAP